MGQWDNQHKDWVYERPLHRINSPCWSPGRAPANGQGYAAGCRAPSDDLIRAVRDYLCRLLMRTLPGWVPVAGEAETELEGHLHRSFQTWTDVPVWQWHRWYDWNFHVIPAYGYEYVKGLGNTLPAAPSDEDSRFVGSPDAMECEWDCGAFAKMQGIRPNLGGMFSADWAWPLAGQYVWLAGRWIYDCGHASNDNKDPKNGPVGLMRTELHPCKALATARWEAFKFPENNNLYVPAIQFMFFASHNGGYKDPKALNSSDYEFIVDLPKLGSTAAIDSRIGASPEFPLNTVVLRSPHLLHDFNYAPFSNATGTAASVVPILEVIAPDDPGTPPSQVKIKIPLSQATSGDYYGVIVSLGWYDPDGTQARKIKHCQVKLDHLFKGDVDHDFFSEEWLIKICVNGRWYTQYWDGVRNNTQLKLTCPVFDLWLSEDDFIYVSSHGSEMDLIGDFFERPQNRRTLTLDGVPMDWDRDIVPWDQEKLWRLCRRMTWMMASTFKDENDPLGLIDPGQGPIGNANYLQNAGNGVRLGNPVKLKSVKDGTYNFVLTAFSTDADPRSAELIESDYIVDYTLNFSVDIKRQQVP